MSLKTGDWKMNENGREMTLIISNIDVNAAVTGNLVSPGNLPDPLIVIAGLWDETSRTLTFAFPIFETASSAVSAMLLPKFYKGFLFSTPLSPVPGVDVVWTLAGSVQVTDLRTAAENGGNTRRNEFGWFAQITEVS
jgi:hypothetical protein